MCINYYFYYYYCYDAQFRGRAGRQQSIEKLIKCYTAEKINGLRFANGEMRLTVQMEHK